MTDILLASGSFSPREGGAEKQMRNVLSLAARSGASVSVVTQVIDGQPRRSSIDGVNVTRVGSVSLFRGLPRIGQLLFTVLVFVHVLVRRPSAVISIQLGTASVGVALARRFCSFNHVVRLTGGGTATHRSEPFARGSSRVGRWAVRMITSKKVTIAAPAEHLLEDFRTVFGPCAALRIVPNGVPELKSPIPCVDAERTGVVWYARRGAIRSSEAFEQVVDAAPDLAFTIIGATDRSSDQRVRALGWVEDPYPILGRHRVLLNTSPTEGMPNMVLQALAIGMRVVGPANAGLIELARRFPDRIELVDLARPHEVADALRRCHSMDLPGGVHLETTSESTNRWLGLLL
ncbi:glycosyltransferase [Terrabacter sp. Root85]|uniref:glycosyltransferase n=1 Tax=Terrabacter sp. Root85 TaxID=1736603 RepID=UPI0009E87E24